MICEKCNMNNDDNAKRCAGCGAVLTTTACGGFGDILNYTAPANTAPQGGAYAHSADPYTQRIYNNSQELIAKTDKNRLLSLISLGIAGSILVLTIVFSAVTLNRVNKLSTPTDETTATNDEETQESSAANVESSQSDATTSDISVTVTVIGEDDTDSVIAKTFPLDKGALLTDAIRKVHDTNNKACTLIETNTYNEDKGKITKITADTLWNSETSGIAYDIYCKSGDSYSKCDTLNVPLGNNAEIVIINTTRTDGTMFEFKKADGEAAAILGGDIEFTVSQLCKWSLKDGKLEIDARKVPLEGVEIKFEGNPIGESGTKTETDKNGHAKVNLEGLITDVGTYHFTAAYKDGETDELPVNVEAPSAPEGNSQNQDSNNNNETLDNTKQKS